MSKSIYEETVKDLIELIERDTPEKIEYNDYDYPCCPECGEVQCSNVYAMNNDFCPYCGQRLEWSKELENE